MQIRGQGGRKGKRLISPYINGHIFAFFYGIYYLAVNYILYDVLVRCESTVRFSYMYRYVCIDILHLGSIYKSSRDICG